jgi:hypothetical protein
LHHDSSDSGARATALWIGLLAGPAVWLVLLETNYVLSYVACGQRQTWMLHLAAAVALLLVAGAAAAAWRAAPPAGGDGPGGGASTDPARTRVIRARFQAVAGLVLCIWFAVVIVATDIPVLVLRPCAP